MRSKTQMIQLCEYHRDSNREHLSSYLSYRMLICWRKKSSQKRKQNNYCNILMLLLVILCLFRRHILYSTKYVTDFNPTATAPYTNNRKVLCAHRKKVSSWKPYVTFGCYVPCMCIGDYVEFTFICVNHTSDLCAVQYTP